MHELSRRGFLAVASLAFRTPALLRPGPALPPAPPPPPTAVLDFAIAGALHHALGKPGMAPALSAQPGLSLILRREPENPFDPFAVAVHAALSGPRLGYVPRWSSEAVAMALDEGVTLQASVLRALERRDASDEALVATDFREGEPRLRLFWLG